MAEQIKDEELTVDQTEGFKVGEKKTIDEYQKLGTYFVINPLMFLSRTPS